MTFALLHTNPGTAKRNPLDRVFIAVSGFVNLLAAAGFVVVITGALLFTVAARVSPDGNPVFFGHEALIVRSGSMAPSFSAGDAVIVRHETPANAALLKVGDTITFRAASSTHMLVTHRITAVRRDGTGQPVFVTKGDANPQADADTVSAADVVGTVTNVLPRFGYVMNAIQNRQAFLMFGISLILVRLALPMLRLADGQDTTQSTNGEQE